jgi:hypothetical protein
MPNVPWYEQDFAYHPSPSSAWLRSRKAIRLDHGWVRSWRCVVWRPPLYRLELRLPNFCRTAFVADCCVSDCGSPCAWSVTQLVLLQTHYAQIAEARPVAARTHILHERCLAWCTLRLGACVRACGSLSVVGIPAAACIPGHMGIQRTTDSLGNP